MMWSECLQGRTVWNAGGRPVDALGMATAPGSRGAVWAEEHAARPEAPISPAISHRDGKQPFQEPQPVRPGRLLDGDVRTFRTTAAKGAWPLLG